MQTEQNEKILRLGAVLDKTGISRSSLYNMIKDGLFPKPVSIGIRSSGWIQSEVNAWIQERIIHRNYNEST